MIAARIQNRINFGPAGSDAGGAACSIGILLCDNRYTDAGAILRDSSLACKLAVASGPGSCLSFDHDSIRHAFSAA
jgi:GGDEF domain-containing protein